MEEELTESGQDQESVQTSSTPTPSETTESQSVSSPDRDTGSSTPSALSDPIDAGPSEENHKTKDAGNNTGSNTAAESKRTDNDVDEGVDLQGKFVQIHQRNSGMCHLLFIVYCHFCHTHKIEKINKKKIRQGSPRNPIRLMNRTIF